VVGRGWDVLYVMQWLLLGSLCTDVSDIRNTCRRIGGRINTDPSHLINYLLMLRVDTGERQQAIRTLIQVVFAKVCSFPTLHPVSIGLSKRLGENL